MSRNSQNDQCSSPKYAAKVPESIRTPDQPRPKALKTDHGRLAEVSLVNFQFQDMEVQR